MGKFIEWEQAQPRRQSFSAFARYLGIRQTTFSQWITGNGIPSYEKAMILAQKLSDEVYDVTGYARPGDSVPPEVRAVLEGALIVIRERGLATNSPEAMEVIIAALMEFRQSLTAKT